MSQRAPHPSSTRAGAPPRCRHSRIVFAVAQATLSCIVAGTALGAAPAAFAQAAAPARTYDIPAGPLTTVLNRFGREAGILLSFSTELTGSLQSAGLTGTYTVPAALGALLSGTSLEAVRQGDGGYLLQRAAQTDRAAPSAASGATLAEVRVTAGRERADGLPATYAGGQVARGGRVGMLGNRDVMDTPFNQTSYTSELIENQQAQTISDVLRNDASVRSFSPAGSWADYFLIRGFDVSTANVSFNGLYGLTPFYGSIPTEFTERVEVLKGPNALLSGMSLAGVVGGSVNIVPKRAADDPLTRVTLGVSSDSLWTANLDVGRRFGERKEWGIRINGGLKNGDTFIDGQSRKDDTGAIALDYRGERLRVALDAYRFNQKTEGGTGLFASIADGLSSIPRAPDGATNMYPGIWVDQKTQGAVLSGDFDINGNWTAFAKVGTMRFDSSGFQGGGLSGLQANGNASILPVIYPVVTRNTSGELGVRGRFATGAVGHDLVVSASRVNREFSSAFGWVSSGPFNIYAPPAVLPASAWPKDPGAPVKSSELTLQSVALADTLSMLDDRALLTLGVRHQNVQSDNFNTLGAVTSGYDKSAVTPMVGLVVKPSESVSLYANYIEGLSQGTTVGNTYRNAGEIFPPYKTKQYEMGVKADLGQVITTLSAFQISKPSTVSVSNGAGQLPTLSLDGEQRNRGLEWTVAGQVTPHLRLLGGITYIDGRLTKTQGGTNDGHHAPGVAPWAINVGADWDVPGVRGLAVNGRVVYTASQYYGNSDALKIPSWTTVDIGARFATAVGTTPVVLRATVRNLFNRSYWSSVQGSTNLTLGAPRTFALTASVDF